MKLSVKLFLILNLILLSSQGPHLLSRHFPWLHLPLKLPQWEYLLSNQPQCLMGILFSF